MTTTLTTPTLPEAKPPRMEPLARLPVFFALEGRRTIIAGGTPGAAWKAELLSAAGAEVAVYSASLSDQMIGLAIDRPPASLPQALQIGAESEANVQAFCDRFVGQLGVVLEAGRCDLIATVHRLAAR